MTVNKAQLCQSHFWVLTSSKSLVLWQPNLIANLLPFNHFKISFHNFFLLSHDIFYKSTTIEPFYLFFELNTCIRDHIVGPRKQKNRPNFNQNAEKLRNIHAKLREMSQTLLFHSKFWSKQTTFNSLNGPK